MDSERRSNKYYYSWNKGELVKDREKRETEVTDAAFVNELLEFNDCKYDHSEYRLGREDESNAHHRPIKVIFN